MMVIGIPLLTLLLYVRPGGSINCFFCPDETLSSECTDTKNCTNMDLCKTRVLSPNVGFPFQGNEVVTRGCARSGSCRPSDLDELGNSDAVFCCSLDLCNNRGLNASFLYGDGSAASQTRVTTGVLLVGISLPLMVMWQ